MADSDSSLTPEQRLLKLIEEQESSETGQEAEKSVKQEGPVPRAQPSFDVKALLTPGSWKESLTGAKNALSENLLKHKDKIQLQHVNNALKIMTALFGVYLAVSIFFDTQLINRDYAEELKVSSSLVNELDFGEDKGFGLSLFEGFDARNVFSPSGKKSDQANEKSPTTLRILEMTQNFKLTGISKHPDNKSRTFCMIEDLERNITTFLREGDNMQGLVVDEIKSDSVILKYQDEVIEIR